MNSNLTIILSGHVNRPQNFDLRPFWLGFIELQNKLPSSMNIQNILAHSWNPEFSELVELVYSPKILHAEKQDCFYDEFIGDIDPPDFFENGLERLNSTWKNVSIHSVIGNARSRARAISLMNRLPASEMKDQVLITRWDIGQTGSSEVNQMVLDPSLPKENIYLAYYSEVDEGYADMWIVAPWQLALRFELFDIFCLECLKGRNEFLDSFTHKGWPASKRLSKVDIFLASPYVRHLHRVILRVIELVKKKLEKSSLLRRLVTKVFNPFILFVSAPPVTAENSLLIGGLSSEQLRVFPKYQALNIHALLKYFFLSEKMREQTRFLTAHDFEISDSLGNLINPQPFVLILEAEDLSNEGMFDDLVSTSPLPIAGIYVVQGNQILEVLIKDNGSLFIECIDVVNIEPSKKLAFVLDLASRKFSYSMPILFLRSIKTYLGCSDWSYLNALLKYILWSGIDYVGIDCSLDGRYHNDFPDMKYIRGEGAISFEKAAGTLGKLDSLFKSTFGDVNALICRAELMKLDFSCTSSSRSLF